MKTEVHKHQVFCSANCGGSWYLIGEYDNSELAEAHATLLDSLYDFVAAVVEVLV